MKGEKLGHRHMWPSVGHAGGRLSRPPQIPELIGEVQKL